jgi:hypothetical protein
MCYNVETIFNNRRGDKMKEPNIRIGFIILNDDWKEEIPSNNGHRNTAFNWIQKNNLLNVFNNVLGTHNINDEEDFVLKIKDDGFNLDLLNVDITATRNLESYPISQILQQVISINPENSEKSILSFSEITNGSKFEDDQIRIRFVFTNGGRLLNVSCYNSDKKIYENLGSYSFTQALNESKIYVYNSSSSISNVSTNF